MKKYAVQSGVRHKKSVKGATLLEVLVSVFLLTFGILGLMAAQLRSVASVSESESQSIAAQAAENLAEAMQANTILDENGARTFANYIQTGWTTATAQASCDSSKITASGGTASKSKDACLLNGDDISKDDLVKAHLGEFQYVLNQIPNVVGVKYTICYDVVDDPKVPTWSDAKCDNGKSNKPVIKVVWKTQDNKTTTTSGSTTTVHDDVTTSEHYYVVAVTD